jgi:L-gulono-1,4-lactone dehydrogenase
MRNWARNQRWMPAARRTPTAVSEVAQIVADAHRAGQHVKAIGAGHSFTAAATTDGVQVTLDRLDQVIDVDHPTGRVTVGAGIRLRRLNEVLAAAGLALPNLGDIDRQSLAGAIATATHGTGLTLGNLATTVVGMQMVTGTGDIVKCADTDVESELLRVARVGLGALGIVTEITLQCVPAFDLRARETVEVLDEVLDGFAEQAAAVDHFELYWMPGTRRCQVKRNTRTDERRAPQPRWAYVRDKWLGENIGFGAVCRVGRRFPALTPRISRLVASAVSERDLVDRSDRVFCSPRHVHFVEMEYGVPVDHVPEAVRRVRQLTSTLPTPVLFPIEVRVSAADDIALSTGFGRTSGWIAVHQYRGAPYEEYFAGVERIMDDYEGRPHWGKLHGQRAATLAPRYPHWQSFAAARDRLDPDRTFANPYLDRVLG